MEGPPPDVPWLVPRPDVPWNAPFRDAVDAFLSQYGTLVADLGLPNVSAWVVELGARSGTLPGARPHLHVYEERVEEHTPTVCDPCRIIGAPRRPATSPKERKTSSAPSVLGTAWFGSASRQGSCSLLLPCPYVCHRHPAASTACPGWPKPAAQRRLLQAPGLWYISACRPSKPPSGGCFRVRKFQYLFHRGPVSYTPREGCNTLPSVVCICLWPKLDAQGRLLHTPKL